MASNRNCRERDSRVPAVLVEHDPRVILTEGDRSLFRWVCATTSTGRRPSTWNQPEWFTLHGPATKSVDVAAGDATRGMFDFRAVASLKDGKQRITAIAADANDAIEKPVTVHPDGEEKSVSASDIITNSGSLALDLPETIIPNSVQVNENVRLDAHVRKASRHHARRTAAGNRRFLPPTPVCCFCVITRKQGKTLRCVPGRSATSVRATIAC